MDQSTRVSVSNKGWVIVGGIKFYARSSWEANIAAYLQFLVETGEIEKWEHEPETFWFEAIRRGVRSYLPDFRVTYKNGKVEYIEVKGYMDSKSKTKINRMRIYHPTVILRVIGKTEYKRIAEHSVLFKEWGKLTPKEKTPKSNENTKLIKPRRSTAKRV
jgi:hypothetical protein